MKRWKVLQSDEEKNKQKQRKIITKMTKKKMKIQKKVIKNYEVKKN